MASRTVSYGANSFNISYEILNPSIEQTIVFLHGWGSNKELMRQAFGKTLSNWRHIYLDLPGFGNTPNDIFLTTADYAKIVDIFLREIKITPKIVAGHSFGGKVATLLNSQCLVLLSSAGIQVPKPLSIRIKIKIFKLLKILGVSRLRDIFVSEDAKGMSEGMYETFKATVNEDFEANFSKIDSKTLLFWGKDDSATPLFTGEKIAKLIKDSKLYPLEGDHYFFLNSSNATSIAKIIEEDCGSY